MNPIAYTYDADTYCPACTIARFGTSADGYWPPEAATDSEGNPVHAIFSWDEWCEPTEPGTHSLVCGTCEYAIAWHKSDYDDDLPPSPAERDDDGFDWDSYRD